MTPTPENCPLTSGEDTQFFRLQLLHGQPETVLTQEIAPEEALPALSLLIACSVCITKTTPNRPKNCPIPNLPSTE